MSNKKRKTLKAKPIEKELEEHFLTRDDYWDEFDDYLIDDEDHAALLGERQTHKLAFGFYVDDHIRDVYPKLGLPLDECMAILKVRFDRNDCADYHEKEVSTRPPWIPLPNEHGVVPWIGTWKRELLSQFPSLRHSGLIYRTSNRDMRKCPQMRMKGMMAMYEKHKDAVAEDKARYMREMEEAKKKTRKDQ